MSDRQTTLYFNLIFALLLSAALSACAPGKSANSDDSKKSGEVGTPDAPIYQPEKPLWEGHHSDGVFWSAFAYELVATQVAAQLLPGSRDVADFCPNYAQGSDAEKVNFWVYLVSAMVKYESNFNPASRYLESTLGTDEVTGEPVYSEGLLQLSYQDAKTYPFCQFDWATDKKLRRTDLRKTILNPLLNLDCGIKILARQIERQKDIALKSGVYWAVLKIGGKYTKLDQIKALTKALPFCKIR